MDPIDLRRMIGYFAFALGCFALIAWALLNEPNRIGVAHAVERQLVHAVALARMDIGCFPDVHCDGNACLANLENLTSHDMPVACVFGDMEPPPHCRADARERGHVGRCWNGPYIARVPKDPWGRDYTATTDASGFVWIRSAGPDEVPGTPDDIVEAK